MDRAEMLQQMIADYRRKIELYQAMIAEWERELGRGSVQPEIKHPNIPAGTSKNGSESDPVSMVKEWQFYGKSQVEAAKMLLELVKHPLSTNHILEGIEKGGVKIGGKTERDRKTNFYTILHRSKEFVRIARDTWALSTWPGVSKKNADEDFALQASEEGKSS